MDARIIAAASGGSTPVVKPTRAQILDVKTHGMQGMTCVVSQPGGPKPIPWTDGLITSPMLTADDRQTVYAAHRELGDTHMLIVLTWAYREGGLPYVMPGIDLSDDLPAFRRYVEEIINAGFYPMVFLGGDGMSTSDGPPWHYNDPVGDTYGFQWLMANFQRVYDSLSDLAPWIIWSPGFDGVVPAWQPPSCVDKWLLHARSIVGDAGYLALELSMGYPTWGSEFGEGDNYPTPGGQALDLVLTEMPVPLGPPAPYPPDYETLPNDQKAPWSQCDQVMARLTRPWHRDPSQPPNDDPNPPFLLAPGTPRGQFYSSCFEISTYDWVRDRITVEGVDAQRQALRQRGIQSVG